MAVAPTRFEMGGTSIGKFGEARNGLACDT